MKAIQTYALLFFGFVTCFGLQFVGMAMGAQLSDDTPMLVVAPPWSGGAEEVVRVAGGSIVGPTQAPLSALATGASVDAFKSAGAWFLVDPGALSFFCVSG